MPQAVLKILVSPQKLGALPWQTTEVASRTSALARIALLVPALLLVLIPVGSLLLSSPALAVAYARPAEAMLATGGVAIFSLLFGLPLVRVLGAIGAERTVRIEGGVVTVVDRGLFGCRSWSAPLAAFRGLVHCVRTSLSGTRHELILEHADRRRRVLLCAAEHICEADLAQAAATLHLPLLPARDLYRWAGLPRLGAPAPLLPVPAAAA